MTDDQEIYAELFGSAPEPTEQPMKPAAPVAPAPMPPAPILPEKHLEDASTDSELDYSIESSDDDDFVIILKHDLVAKQIQKLEETSAQFSRDHHEMPLAPITSIPVRTISNRGGDEMAWEKGKEIIANSLAVPIPEVYIPPIVPDSHKSIYEFDIDSVHDKAWRRQGSDVSDYFNYGFNEQTWRLYCKKQADFRTSAAMTFQPTRVQGPPHRVQPLSESIPVQYSMPVSSAGDEELPPGQTYERPQYQGGYSRRRR
ncbi:hypothetical protein RCL1_007392 [Eukaryota sp. TZLM3-RCL]